jgi:hypothetical protein
LSFSFVAASLRPVYCTSFAQESGIHRHTMSFVQSAAFCRLKRRCADFAATGKLSRMAAFYSYTDRI